mmetsp:Transcript_25407/g.76643  ORF Transcript_25407/g.76643 Transcript_25407/m.76643 type:complete len:503 (+) Transcript_25407:48-1556(+)
MAPLEETAGADSVVRPELHIKEGEVVWEVVGGKRQGGIIVRAGRSLASPLVGGVEEDGKCELSRLSTSSLVKQLELRGSRLRFKRLTGEGPDFGWISTSQWVTSSRPARNAKRFGRKWKSLVVRRCQPSEAPGPAAEVPVGALTGHELHAGLWDGGDWAEDHEVQSKRAVSERARAWWEARRAPVLEKEALQDALRQMRRRMRQRHLPLALALEPASVPSPSAPGTPRTECQLFDFSELEGAEGVTAVSSGQQQVGNGSETLEREALHATVELAANPQVASAAHGGVAQDGDAAEPVASLPVASIFPVRNAHELAAVERAAPLEGAAPPSERRTDDAVGPEKRHEDAAAAHEPESVEQQAPARGPCMLAAVAFSARGAQQAECPVSTPLSNVSLRHSVSGSEPEVFDLAADDDEGAVMAEAAEVKQWLEGLGLGRYFSKLLDEGCDDLRIISGIDDDMLRELVGICKMPRLHAHQFQKAVWRLQAAELSWFDIPTQRSHAPA